MTVAVKKSPARARTQMLVVDDVMSAPVSTVCSSEAVWAAIDRLRICGLRHLVVVDDAGTFAGVLDDRVATDLVRHDRCELELARVRDLALDRSTSVPSGTGLRDAAEHMLRQSAGAVAVLDGRGRILGIVTGADLLRAIVVGA